MWSYILPPLFGGIIGYITNDIAIRMLFRPHRAKYVMGVHVPFTPGIIPKEKGRIAKAMGDAISVNLMNKEVLERSLLSDELIGKIVESIDSFCKTQSRNEESVAAFASHYLTEEELERLFESSSEELEKILSEKLAESDFGRDIARMATEHAKEKVSSGLFGMLGAGKIAEIVSTIAEPLLAKEINNMIHNNSRTIIRKVIQDQGKELMNTPMKVFFVGHEEQIEQAKVSAISIYRVVILEHLPKILSSLNISQMIEVRINEMDMNEIEPIILEVMNKELKAIVWFGAGLGSLIGCVNIFV